MARESIVSKINRGVYPSESEFRQYYIVENHSQADTAKHFNITRSIVQNLAEFWQVVKDVEKICALNSQKSKSNRRSVSSKILSGEYPDFETFKSYYIDDNNSRVETAKHFGITETAVTSLVNHFNLHKTNDNVSDTRKSTCLKRYGVSSNLQSEECKEKIKQTCLERYGVSHISQADEVKEKVRNTFIKKYGVEHVLQNKEIKDKINRTIKQRYGVDWACQLKSCKDASHGKNSKPNLRFEKILEDNNIKFTREFNLDTYSYDFKVNNILIEIDPWFTHQSTFDNKFGKKSKQYHSDKSSKAVKNDFHCIHIFDWDDQGKIVKTFLVNKPKCYARQCEIREVTKEQEIDYLNKNHLQGYIKSDICLGLFFNDELACLMSFGKPRYNRNYEYELLRLCSSYQVVGGAAKLFNYFINSYEAESVISYCDLSKFNGEVYKKLGFKLLRKSISKHWYSPATKKHITDNLLRKQGFDHLLGNLFGRHGKGSNNESLMIENGFVEIYDAGQATYVFTKK